MTSLPAGRRAATLVAAVAALALPGLVQAHGKAHQHGVATMDVVLAGNTLSIELDTPLDNLVGFERAARTAGERERVDRMAATLRQAETVFKPDAAAQCKPSTVKLDAPVVGLADSGGAAAPAEKGHADLAARFEFQCQAPAQLQQVEVGLFTAFSGFKRIEVQMAREGRQGKRTLTPTAARLSLPR
jgi:hypothetical protein